MRNGIEAMKDTAGELTIKSELAKMVNCSSPSATPVSDCQPKRDQIFSAFFTTKPQGSGMDLAICRAIVESHSGRLWASANNGGRDVSVHPACRGDKVITLDCLRRGL
jgi:sensor histidine kinase regulating citrate/malate metabolism